MGYTISISIRLHWFYIHEHYISDWPAATLIGKYMHMIITFLIGLRQHSSECDRKLFTVVFIYLCGQITIGLLLGETFLVWSNDMSSNES